MTKPKQIVSKVERSEWFTNVGKPDGVVYRSVKTGAHTAKYEVVARGCSAKVAEQIAALPEVIKALKMARDCIAYCRRAHKDAQSGEGIPVELFIDKALAAAGV